MAALFIAALLMAGCGAADGRKKISLRVKIFVMTMSLVAATVLVFAILGLIQFWRFANLIRISGEEQDRVILLGLQKKLNKAGGELRLVNVPDTVKEIFDVTGYSRFLNIV